MFQVLGRLILLFCLAALELAGPAYTVYLLDAVSVTGAEQYLLQVTVEVKRVGM